MKVYLVSNNLLQEGLYYDNNTDLDTIRMTRPLSIEGDNLSKELASKDIFNNIEKIYTSFYTSSISTSKYLARKLDLRINLTDKLNECKVGILGSKNMKMVKGLQDHEFSYKLPNGESLIEVGNRLNNFINNINNENVILFTHKRIILGYLLKYAKVGYNLDDNLILSYNDNIIYDDTDTNIDIYEIEMENNKVINISLL